MKLLKKISIGSINSVRGGLKNVTGRVLVAVIAGITGSYKEKTSETMKTSYAFNGEFRAVNKDGEECAAAVCFLPEPAQSLLKTQIDDLSKVGGLNVEFGFRIFAVEDSTSIVGYIFEVEPLMEARASTAMADLAKRIGVALPDTAAPALGHDAQAEAQTDAKTEAAPKGGKRGK